MIAIIDHADDEAKAVWNVFSRLPGPGRALGEGAGGVDGFPGLAPPDPGPGGSVRGEKGTEVLLEFSFGGFGKGLPEIPDGLFRESHPAVKKTEAGQNQGIVRMARQGFVEKDVSLREVSCGNVDLAHQGTEAGGPNLLIHEREECCSGGNGIALLDLLRGQIHGERQILGVKAVGMSEDAEGFRIAALPIPDHRELVEKKG